MMRFQKILLNHSSLHTELQKFAFFTIKIYIYKEPITGVFVIRPKMDPIREKIQNISQDYNPKDADFSG